MHTLKTLLLFILAAAACTDSCLARAVYSFDMKTLMARSTLVLVGKVKSVEPSGIKTKLAYPTWDQATFEWLKVEVEVIEPIKGTGKGEMVRTLMLSMSQGVMANAPRKCGAQTRAAPPALPDANQVQRRLCIYHRPL